MYRNIKELQNLYSSILKEKTSKLQFNIDLKREFHINTFNEYSFANNGIYVQLGHIVVPLGSYSLSSPICYTPDSVLTITVPVVFIPSLYNPSSDSTINF